MNSLWIDELGEINSSGELEYDTNADICIIGAGISGITTAYYLTKKGFKTVVIERNEIGHGVTGHTTAKITSQHALIYHYLFKQYGIEFAEKYFKANEKAIKNIEEIIIENNIDCDFERKDNYIYTINEENIEKIKEEAESLKHININAELVEKSDLKLKIKRGIVFKNQAQFNPLKYITGLVKYILNNNGKIYKNSLCTDIKRKDGEYEVWANGHKVYAKYVVLATQYPFLKIPGFYFIKMYQASSYVIGIETKEKLPKDMYLSIDEPNFSFRTAGDILLIGGAGHKTGSKVDYNQTYGVLEKKAKELYPDCKIKYKWSTRDSITLDKIPYIGEYSSLMPNMYVMTGFNKWGMTSSNVAANIIVDKISGAENIYEEIFKSTRYKPIVNKDEMKNMLVDSTKSLILDRVKKENIKTNDIKNNSGAIIDLDGTKVGVYKNEEGKAYYIKPVCTHLGCILEWNDADKTWDCPCHGSRYDKYGKNIYDPAIKNLEVYDFE